MAYIEPLVLVYQEYAALTTSTQTASLPACIIGPCYHIVDPAEDEILALAGTYTKDGFSGLFPNNAPGALIQEDSVSIRVKNSVVQLCDPIIPDVVSVNAVTFAADTFPSDVQIGDSMWLGEAEYRVTSVDAAAYTVMLNRASGLAKSEVYFTRKIDEVLVDMSFTGVQLDCTSEKFDLVGLVDEAGRTILSGELYVGYKALRQDLSDVGVIYSVDEIRAQLGKICPENPLAFGVNVCLANTTTGVYYVGVDSDDLEGYTAAKDRIESYSPLYSIVPLTMQPGVLTMFKMHAEQMSEPESGEWRVAIGCSELPETEILTESAEDAEIVINPDGDGDLIILNDAKASFLSSSVDAGDILYVTGADGTVYEYTVGSVASDDILTITPDKQFNEVLVVDGVLSYFVERTMSRDEQARAVGAASTAYGSKRFWHVWPPVCYVDGEELPGYYLCCAIAGAVAGLEPHYGMTRLSIAGIDAVKYAGDYFNREQLNMIADGGTFIFVQASPTAPPHIRHQLTTDRSAIEFQEASFVKNFDFVCYMCKDAMAPYIGKWNVTDEALSAIRTALTGTLETLRLRVSPKIGSPVLSYNVTSVQRLENTRDRVEVYVDVEFPYPLNTVGLHIVSV